MKFLFEYDDVTNETLLNHIKHNPKLRQFFSSNWGKISTKQYCGLICVEGEDFFILPKISKNDTTKDYTVFIYMLMVAYDLKLTNEDIASAQNREHRILEIFIELFAKRLFEELKFGVLRKYITLENNLNTLRGKYLINENIRHNFTHEKIYCQYDEFSPDNELNRFFLYAIRLFMRYSHSKKYLKICESLLDEVGYQTFDPNRINIRFDRLDQRFQVPFEMAIMILKKLIPIFEQEKQSFAFLFDMNELFEKFVAKLLPDAEIQKKAKFGDLSLKPDIRTENLIIDTKYKIYKNKKDLSRVDKYQMFVYGQNFNLKNTMLLYPKHLNQDIQNNPFNLGDGEECINLYIRSLNLGFDRKDCEFEEYIKMMRERMEEVICLKI